MTETAPDAIACPAADERRSTRRPSSTRCSAGTGRTRPESGRPVVLAAVGVGVLAGLLIPYRDLGLAFFLVLVAAGGHGVVGCEAPHATRSRSPAWCWPALCTLPVVLLDAEWIVALCLLAGTACLVAGVTRGRRLAEFVVAGIAWPLSALRGLPWLARSLRGVLGSGRAPRVLLTALWSAGAVLVFGLLFASADAVVADWLDGVVPDLTIELVRAARLHRRLRRRRDARRGVPRPQPARRLGGPRPHGRGGGAPLRVAGAGPARRRWCSRVFVAAQAAVLFGGHDYVQRSTGLTYAEYVHQGFGQLTVATLLMFLVVWAASRRVGADPGDGLWMRISLGLLCALTLVVVVSALHRMQLYQEAYGFTQARLVVDVFEGWLGVVVLAVAVAGLVRWGTWVPRFALVTGVVGLLGIAAINPDAWIARHNIERYEETGKLDVALPRRRCPPTPYPSWRRPSRAAADPALDRPRRPPTTTGWRGTSAAGAAPADVSCVRSRATSRLHARTAATPVALRSAS